MGGKFLNAELDRLGFNKVVAIVFTEEVPSKNAGYNASKYTKVYDVSGKPEYKKFLTAEKKSDIAGESVPF